MKGQGLSLDEAELLSVLMEGALYGKSRPRVILDRDKHAERVCGKGSRSSCLEAQSGRYSLGGLSTA